jgi:hypothetical protein
MTLDGKSRHNACRWAFRQILRFLRPSVTDVSGQPAHDLVRHGLFS